MENKYRLRIFDSWIDRDRKDVWIIQYSPEGKLFIAEPFNLKFREHDQNTILPSASISLPNDLCQAITDGLLGQGFTPSRESKIEGQLEATKHHLADLRKILKIK